MPKIIKISAIFLFALGVTAPAQASDNWFSNLFPWLTSPIHAETTGVGSGGGDPGVDPSSNGTVNPTGVGGGFGDPGVDPTASTTGVGSGGGNPGVDPN